MLRESHKTLGNRGFHGSYHLSLNSITATSNPIVREKPAPAWAETSAALGNLPGCCHPTSNSAFIPKGVGFGLFSLKVNYWGSNCEILRINWGFSEQDPPRYSPSLHLLQGLFWGCVCFNVGRWNTWSITKYWRHINNMSVAYFLICCMHSSISRVVKWFAFYNSAFRSRNRETFDISFSMPRVCVKKKKAERDQTNAQVSKDAAALWGITLGLTVCEKQIKVGGLGLCRRLLRIN